MNLQCNSTHEDYITVFLIAKSYVHTRFIIDGVAEALDIPPGRPCFTKISLAMRNTADVTDGKAAVYIQLTLYPRRGSTGISNIFPRRPRFTKIT
jgi:hypothetical protein